MGHFITYATLIACLSFVRPVSAVYCGSTVEHIHYMICHWATPKSSRNVNASCIKPEESHKSFVFDYIPHSSISISIYIFTPGNFLDPFVGKNSTLIFNSIRADDIMKLKIKNAVLWTFL